MNYEELLHSPLIPSPTISLARKAAQNNAPVFIEGERGTGKELIAKIIHHSGNWKYYRFYKIDCKILREDAFADQLTRLFNETNFGTIPATLYLKEIDHLKQTDQLRLLEVMEDGIFQNGAEKKIIKDLRVISSSSENLKERVTQGKFSEDLYHQLNTLSIRIPPLRDRTKEISAISEYILEQHSKKMRINKVDISNNVLALLKSYWWPGNLTELEQVIIRSAIFSEGGNLMEKDLLFETESGNNSFTAFLKKAEVNAPEFKHRNLPEEQNAHTLSLFLLELVHRIKNPLVSVKTFTQLLQDKFGDGEFREQFYRIVTEDIEKIDSVLNGLLSYIKINTPIEKRNTVHFILEDVLRNHEMQLEDKKIKIFKKFEKDLPETVIHDEQLRYILNALLQYAVPFIPLNGTIGILTKSSGIQKETAEDEKMTRRDGRYVEILIVFTGYKKPTEKFEMVLGIPGLQKEEAVELELRLIKEIIRKNQGTMKFEVSEKTPRTLISLKFPIERRKLIYYQPVNV
jgi:nitrogen-specific signal transduction histidine kinase